MQLQLQAHRQIVRDHPISQVASVQVMVAWRKQHLAGASVQTVLDQLGIRPVVVVAGTDDELDLVVGREQLDVLVAVTMRFLGVGGLEVDHAAYAGVNGRDVQGATGLQGNLVAGITQLLEQGYGIGLCQGLATRDADITRPVTGHLLKDVFKGAHGAAAEGVGAVAVLATQRATGEAYKDSGQASSARFTLQRVKDFGNT